jgi:hypothetical protein
MNYNKEPSPETLSNDRTNAVHAFSITALGFNGWIASVGAKEDVAMDFWAMQRGKEHPRISHNEWQRNLAAMRIMQTIVYSIDELRPIVILKEIPAAEDLYAKAENVINEVGLSRLPQFDVKTLAPIIKCFLKDIIPLSHAEEVVQQVRKNRGFVEEEVTSIEDMAAALQNTPKDETLEDLQVLPNGMLAEVHRFPEAPSKIVQTPFYQQHVSSGGGAEAYLQAFLEDVKWVSGQM